MSWVVQEDYDNLGWETQRIYGPYGSRNKAELVSAKLESDHRGCRDEERWCYEVWETSKYNA